MSYLLQGNRHDEVHCAFIIVKARVALLKHSIIPLMELTAATMAGRMDKILKRELQLEDSVLCTDSTAVMKNITNMALYVVLSNCFMFKISIRCR